MFRKGRGRTLFFPRLTREGWVPVGAPPPGQAQPMSPHSLWKRDIKRFVVETKAFKFVIVLQVVTESYQRKESEKITSGPKANLLRIIPRA